MSVPVEQQNTEGEVDLQSMDDEFEILNIDTDVEKNLQNMENHNQDSQEQSTSGMKPSSTKKVLNSNPETASTGNDSLPPHSEIPEGISRSQSDPLPYQFQPLRSTSMKGDPGDHVPHPEDVSESTLELNPNEILTEDNPAPPRRGYAFIKINEYKKLKTEANEAERMKLKHNTLMEQHNNLLEQHNALLDLQKSKPQISDTEHEQLKQKAEKNDSIIEQLKSKIECPVCYEIPKRIPIPVCPNGHVVCQSCNRDDCPMCREVMEGGKSLVAATIVENLLHDCDYVLYGCEIFQMKHSDLVKHLDTCPYRFHYNGWTNLSKAAGIKLNGNFVDLGIKASPVTSFYDSDRITFYGDDNVMWPPNAIEYDGMTFFLYVIANEFGGGIWQFIVKRGSERMPWDPPGYYRVRIVVFKPGDHSGCTRHFHQHSILGKLNKNDQLFLTLDNSLMQGLLLDGKFAVTVDIRRTDESCQFPPSNSRMEFPEVKYDTNDKVSYCCDVMRGDNLLRGIWGRMSLP